MGLDQLIIIIILANVQYLSTFVRSSQIIVDCTVSQSTLGCLRNILKQSSCGSPCKIPDKVDRHFDDPFIISAVHWASNDHHAASSLLPAVPAVGCSVDPILHTSDGLLIVTY